MSKMRNRTRASGIQSILRTLIVFLFCLLALLLGLWFLRTFDPFYTLNPFVQDVTIGERVIGPWHYGGLDDSGNLRFYHETGFQTVLIPANLNRFAAGGTYVILLEHSPVNLLFETPGRYMMQVLLQFATGLVVVITLGILFLKIVTTRSKPVAFRTRSRNRR
jgi:hypothetical protein